MTAIDMFQPTSSHPPADIAFFLQDLEGGGAERAIVALAGEIADRGHTVELVVGNADSDYRSEVPPAVRVRNFATTSALVVFFRLMTYLRRRAPATVMSALDVPNIMLVIAAKLVGYRGRTVVSQRAVFAAGLDELGPGRRMLTRFLRPVCFRRADVLISNSHAAAAEARASLGMPPDRVVTIHNALDADRISRLAREPIADEALVRRRVPVLVSVGSLTKRKDMTTLIKAFAIVRRQRAAQLLIVGRGAERPEIERLLSEMGLRDDVHLAGFDANPYKWMAAATVFVSSSIAEGFPNVIAEALALGRAIVATDCPGDTAELLGHGKWGRLVPVGDPERMADAIVAALDDPNPPDGRIRAKDFSPASVGDAYLKVLLSSPEASASGRNS